MRLLGHVRIAVQGNLPVQKQFTRLCVREHGFQCAVSQLLPFLSISYIVNAEHTDPKGLLFRC